MISFQVQRPVLNKLIRVHLKSTDAVVHSIDATLSDVMFPVPCTDCEEGRTVTFSISFNFDAGESYYILIDGGTLKGSMILKLKEVTGETNGDTIVAN